MQKTTMSQLTRGLIMKEREKKLSECNSIPQPKKTSNLLNYSIFGGRND
jgi:hypothetical protein